MILALSLSGCGSSGQSTSSVQRVATAKRRPPKALPVRLAYRALFSLSAAVQDPAAATLSGGTFVLLGGIDAADTSTADVTVADLRGAHRSATLPNAQHDAQAAALSGRVYVFGGGQLSQYDHVLRFDPASASVSTAGSLPRAESDVAVAQLGDTAYVVGGFDGANWLDTIVAWTPTGGARVVAHLPVGLRYAAAAASDGAILIAGGSTPTGASDVV